MDAASFRTNAKAMVDVVADYRESLETLTPVFPVDRHFGDLTMTIVYATWSKAIKLLPKLPPQEGEPFEAITKDVQQLILPAVSHWQSPNFFGFFPANSSYPGIIGDLLSAGLGQQGMLWMTSPAATELEMVTLDWFATMLNLPAHFRHDSGVGGGVIQGTASEAVLVALVAARHQTLKRLGALDDLNVRNGLVAYCSDQTHSCAARAGVIAGLAPSQCRVLKTDEDGALSAATLRAALEEDIAAGRTPFFVTSTIGTTSSTAVDSLGALGAVCQELKVWLHVDAAYAGSACICPEHRGLLDGIELCDSFSFNPHKWLLVTFDCSTLYVKDKNILIDSLSATPEYLRNKASDAGAVDFRDWQVPLGRRFRALKIWFVIRTYGVAGLQAFIRNHVALAAQFEAWTEAHEHFVLAAKRTLALVCLRVKLARKDAETDAELAAREDAMSKQLLERVNQSGRAFLTHTVYKGRYALRVCVGTVHTEAAHVVALQDLLAAELAALLKA